MSASATALLDRARAELASGNFPAALLQAETVLRASTSKDVRAAALFLAGTAAYGMRAYTRATERYGELVAKHERVPDAPQAALALGWAELGLGHLDRARRSWALLARKFPADERAPLALLLAAQVTTQAGELSAAQMSLDQLIQRYPTDPAAGVARLSRSILAVRVGREPDGVRDLRELVQTRQMCAAHERHVLLKALAVAGVEAPSIRVNGHDCALPPAGREPLAQFAAPFLDGASDPDTTPIVLHGLVRLAAEDRLWAEVPALSRDLVTGYPTYPATAGLLARIAGRAASDREWSIVRGTYEQILTRYSSSPLTLRARLDLAEALFRTGAETAAYAQLTQIERVDRAQEQAPRRLFLLAEVSEALGRPQEALAAYDRLHRDYPSAEWTAESHLPRARLLQTLGQREQARALLEDIVKEAEGEAFGEAAVRLGQILGAEAQHDLAVKWYLTAAYVAADSTWGQRALLGALQSLLATGDRMAANAIYRRMRASSAIDPDLLAQARNALQPPDR